MMALWDGWMCRSPRVITLLSAMGYWSSSAPPNNLNCIGGKSGRVMGFYDWDGFADLLMRPNLGNEDRLITIKTLADLAQDKENAIKISRSPKIPGALADVLQAPAPPTPATGYRTDERHQAFVCLIVTRCLSQCSAKTTEKWASTPQLVECLYSLRKNNDKFLGISATCALQMMLKCDQAVGCSRRLMKMKWGNALVDGSGSRSSHQGSSSRTGEDRGGPTTTSHSSSMRSMGTSGNSTPSHSAPGTPHRVNGQRKEENSDMLLSNSTPTSSFTPLIGGEQPPGRGGKVELGTPYTPRQTPVRGVTERVQWSASRFSAASPSGQQGSWGRDRRAVLDSDTSAKFGVPPPPPPPSTPGSQRNWDAYGGSRAAAQVHTTPSTASDSPQQPQSQGQGY